jgi:hypothetical protein
MRRSVHRSVYCRAPSILNRRQRVRGSKGVAFCVLLCRQVGVSGSRSVSRVGAGKFGPSTRSIRLGVQRRSGALHSRTAAPDERLWRVSKRQTHDQFTRMDHDGRRRCASAMTTTARTPTICNARADGSGTLIDVVYTSSPLEPPVLSAATPAA